MAAVAAKLSRKTKISLTLIRLPLLRQFAAVTLEQFLRRAHPFSIQIIYSARNIDLNLQSPNHILEISVVRQTLERTEHLVSQLGFHSEILIRSITP
jgi:hypothetical protein